MMQRWHLDVAVMVKVERRGREGAPRPLGMFRKRRRWGRGAAGDAARHRWRREPWTQRQHNLSFREALRRFSPLHCNDGPRYAGF